MVNILTKHGFSLHTRTGAKGAIAVYIKNFGFDNKYTIHCEINWKTETWSFSGGNVKFFGTIQYPPMNYNRDEREFVSQMETAEYYIRLVNSYPKW